VTGFITHKDLEIYKEKGGTLDTLVTGTFETTELQSDGKVLDVRKASEYQEGHVDGALNIAHTRLLPRQDELDKETKYYVHCQSGGRSAVATALLKREGFNVVLIDDEYANYKRKVLA
jgi:hydroxyacylglutathione hydrolase